MPIRISLLIAALVLLTGALSLALGSLLTGIARSIPSEFALGIGLLPSNTPQCVAAVMSAMIARWGYDWSVELARRAAITPLL